ncbi:MAG: hypothetical protein O7E52_00580 [Candidatus Poribacteria bacterium]|nr:hypothetical protein [Candidatus Poribacteria bacterium]
MSDVAWEKIFSDYFTTHDFDNQPAQLTAAMIKESTRHFTKTSDREVRILVKIDTREGLPEIMRDRGLFILPTKNGVYILIKGEGFYDLTPPPQPVFFTSTLDFELKSAKVGSSEMQHLDYAFNTGLVHHFLEHTDSLYLQIRGRKYTPEFTFQVGAFSVTAKSVQTEVDAGYEGRDVIVLVEAKGRTQNNFIIRQLYYPYRQWRIRTQKAVRTVFFSFDSRDETHSFGEYEFVDENDYNSLRLVKSASYRIVEPSG